MSVLHLMTSSNLSSRRHSIVTPTACWNWPSATHLSSIRQMVHELDAIGKWEGRGWLATSNVNSRRTCQDCLPLHHLLYDGFKARVNVCHVCRLCSLHAQVHIVINCTGCSQREHVATAALALSSFAIQIQAIHKGMPPKQFSPTALPWASPSNV